MPSLPDAIVRRVEPVLLPASASLILIVATEVERRAMLRHLIAIDGKEGIPFASVVGAQTYYVGRCGVHDVALLMCDMGSSNPERRRSPCATRSNGGSRGLH